MRLHTTATTLAFQIIIISSKPLSIPEKVANITIIDSGNSTFVNAEHIENVTIVVSDVNSKHRTLSSFGDDVRGVIASSERAIRGRDAKGSAADERVAVEVVEELKKIKLDESALPIEDIVADKNLTSDNAEIETFAEAKGFFQQTSLELARAKTLTKRTWQETIEKAKAKAIIEAAEPKMNLQVAADEGATAGKECWGVEGDMHCNDSEDFSVKGKPCRPGLLDCPW
jgi:hypothetical protein